MASISALVAPWAAFLARWRFMNCRISSSPIDSSSSMITGEAEAEREMLELVASEFVDDEGVMRAGWAVAAYLEASVRGVARDEPPEAATAARPELTELLDGSRRGSASELLDGRRFAAVMAAEDDVGGMGSCRGGRVMNELVEVEDVMLL
jgi:hypothetical protein